MSKLFISASVIVFFGGAYALPTLAGPDLGLIKVVAVGAAIAFSAFGLASYGQRLALKAEGGR